MLSWDLQWRHHQGIMMNHPGMIFGSRFCPRSFAQSLLAPKFDDLCDSSRPVETYGRGHPIEWANPARVLLYEMRLRMRVLPAGVRIRQPIELEKDGWTRNSLHVATRSNVEGVAARDSATQALPSR